MRHVQKPTRSLYELDHERAVPWGDPMLIAWHRARYAFASRFVVGKRVLDVGSGEGYGAALLSRAAQEVVGIDYSPAAIEHARGAYSRDGLSFELVDIREFALQDGMFDVVTCFEVIEHVEDHDALLEAIVQRLHPDGTLLLSTPNTRSLGHSLENPYHVLELTTRELKLTVRRHFGEVQVRGQVPSDRVTRSIIKTLDPFNLRRRVRSSHPAGRRLVERAAPERPDQIPPTGFRFSRLLLKDAFILVAIAREPRRPGTGLSQ